MFYAITLDEQRRVGRFRDADEFATWRFGEQGGVECLVLDSHEALLDALTELAKREVAALAWNARRDIHELIPLSTWSLYVESL